MSFDFFNSVCSAIVEKDINEKDLIALVQQGGKNATEAMEQLISRYYKIISNTAKAFNINSLKNEILSACIEGFMNAVQSYKGYHSDKYKFGTYAVRVMKMHSLSMIAKMHTAISYNRKTYLTIVKAAAMLNDGKSPREISQAAMISEKKLKSLQNELENRPIDYAA